MHIQVNIAVTDASLREVLIAELSEIAYEGFEEAEEALIAYIQNDAFNEQALKDIMLQHGSIYTTTSIPEQNWNSIWEQNFEPVVVDGVCIVRADFHDIEIITPYEIIITPKMSFGTGHHATTQLMMQQMSKIDFVNKHVFDFGTGTGILAILAEMLGAASVLAIDNDEWSFENAGENIARNSCRNIYLERGSLEDVLPKTFDIILANINRNILLSYMATLYNFTAESGFVLMSGLLYEDKDIIAEAAQKQGFSLQGYQELNKWLIVLFKRGI